MFMALCRRCAHSQARQPSTSVRAQRAPRRAFASSSRSKPPLRRRTTTGRRTSSAGRRASCTSVLPCAAHTQRRTAQRAASARACSSCDSPNEPNTTSDISGRPARTSGLRREPRAAMLTLTRRALLRPPHRRRMLLPASRTARARCVAARGDSNRCQARNGRRRVWSQLTRKKSASKTHAAACRASSRRRCFCFRSLWAHCSTCLRCQTTCWR